jgi:hypothetical protein
VRQSPASKDVNTKAVTRKQLEKYSRLRRFLGVAVNCRVCELAIVLYLILVMTCKNSVNQIINVNPVYSHSDM